VREDASHPSVISQGSLECREEFRVEFGYHPRQIYRPEGLILGKGRRINPDPQADTVEKFRVRLGFD